MHLQNPHNITIIRKHFTVIALTVMFFYQTGISQDSGLINLENVHQRKVRKYIMSRNIDKLTDFSSLEPSLKKGTNTAGFNKDEKTFHFRDKISSVWDNYRFSNPVKSWRGRFVRVSLLISKRSNSVYYPDTSAGPTLDTGQVYFLNLRFLEGLFKLPVAFEIINIDPTARIIEYSYIEDNIEKGKQTIQLFDEGEDRTKVIHTSYFKSKYPFRDNVIYPFFHKKIIRDFHKKMRRQDNRQKREIISLTSS